MTTIYNVNIRFVPAGMNFIGDIVLIGNVAIMADGVATMNREADIIVESDYFYRQGKVFAFSVNAADLSINTGIQKTVKEHLHATHND